MVLNVNEDLIAVVRDSIWLGALHQVPGSISFLHYCPTAQRNRKLDFFKSITDSSSESSDRSSGNITEA